MVHGVWSSWPVIPLVFIHLLLKTFLDIIRLIHRSETQLDESLPIGSKVVHCRQICLGNDLQSRALLLIPSLQVSQNVVLGSGLGLDEEIAVEVLVAIKPISLLIIKKTHHHSPFLVVLIQNINCFEVAQISSGIKVSFVLIQREYFCLGLVLQL